MASDDNPVLGNCYFMISADKTEIIEGENVQFTIDLYGGCNGDFPINIYINDIFVENEYLSGRSLLYTHTFNESGEFTVRVGSTDASSITDGSIDITVEEAVIVIESPTPQVSWKINNKNVQSIEINNKEVQSIVEQDTGTILFQKSNDIDTLLEFTFEGRELTQDSDGSFSGANMTIDYGDGTIESTTGKFGHTYSENGTYQVKIYGVTSLGEYCFRNCTGLTSITLPNSITSIEDYCFTNCVDLTSITIPDGVTSLGVSCFHNCTGLTSIVLPNNVSSLSVSCFYGCTGLTSIVLPDSVSSLLSYCFYGCTGLTSINIPSNVTNLGGYCFEDCTGLTSIQLNWTGTDILGYLRGWIKNTNSNLKFKIPYGTTQLYVDKGYPSDKLEEEIPFNNIILSTDKSVLSSYHNDSCTLTAQLMHDSTPANISGVTVTFSTEEGHEFGTVQTNASGVATMTYTSEGISNINMVATAGDFTSETCTIEDCFYSKPTQLDKTRSGTTIVQRLNEDIISNLPATYTIDFDMKTTNNPPSNAEQRIYWVPNQLWTDNGSQPSLASFFGFCYVGGEIKLEAGKRLNSKTDESSSLTINANQWTHVKLENKGDNKFYHYYGDDDTYYTWWTVTGMSNYSDFIFGVILWSDTTFSIKNIKIKSTTPKVVKVDDGSDGPEIE